MIERARAIETGVETGDVRERDVRERDVRET